MATLEEALVPLFLHHRYQVEAAVKLVAGQWYSYALRGDGQVPLRQVPAADQLRALESVLATIRPEALALPRSVLAVLPPRPTGYQPHRELFDRETGLVFDAITPGVAAADLVVDLLLDPQRAARLVQQHALDAGQPSLEGVLARLVAATFGPVPTDGYLAQLQRGVQRVVTERLMGLASGAGSAQVRALAEQALDEIERRATVEQSGASVAEAGHRKLLARDIVRFRDRDWAPARSPRAPGNPPGSPIGSEPGTRPPQPDHPEVP